MRIRTQTLLIITPIFAALGIAIGLVVYAAELGEMEWGIEEEASSLALTISEFIAGDQLSSAQENVAFREKIKSILRFDQLKKLRLYRLKDGKPELAWEVGDEKYTPPSAPKTAEGDMPSLSRFELPEDILAVRAVSNVTSSNGANVGLVEVVTDATRLHEHSKTILKRNIEMTLALIGVGILISLAISGFLSYRLRRFNEVATDIALGDYEQKMGRRMIREIEDLRSTFNTMSSVLKDVLSKAKKELVEAEQFRNPNDLAVTCRDLNPRGLRREIDGHEIVLQLAGTVPSGDFGGIHESNGTTSFVLGKVAERDPLEGTILANAAQFYVQRLLDTHEPVEAIRKLKDSFELEGCAIFQHTGSGSLECSQDPEGFLVTGNALEFGKTILTTARPEVRDRIARFLESADNVTGEELNLLLMGEPLAACLVIRPSAG